MMESNRVATNLRLLLMVETLAKAGRPLTATELNAELELPKQSIHRLCQTLLVQGFIQRSNKPRRFEPGPRLRRAAAGLLRAASVDIGRRQVLESIVSVVHEAVNFVVAEPAGMLYLDRVDADWPFRVQLPVGSHVPFHCTASGKTYLSTLPVRSRRALIQALELPCMASNTIIDADALDAEVEQVRDQGYAVDNEEFMDGLIALSVPVVDRQGTFVAALAFHGPVQRLGVAQALGHLELLRDGARRLGELLDPPC